MMMALSTAKVLELPSSLRHSNTAPVLRSRRATALFFPVSLRVSERNAAAGDSNPRRPGHSSARTRRYPWDDDYNDGKPDRSRYSTTDPGPPRRRSAITAPVPPLTRSTPSPPWLQRRGPDAAEKNKKNDHPEPESAEKAGSPEGSPGLGGPIERIVHRLRSLGLDEDLGKGRALEDAVQDGDIKLGDLLERRWNRPDMRSDSEDDDVTLPWERTEVSGMFGLEEELKKKRVRAPTLAELTIEDTELRRLRQLGIALKDRITIPKAGVTQAIVQNIHDAWRKSELVRLKFHETLAHDMKLAHELVERRTGGLVIWRAGSVMVVYRGSTYKRPLNSELNPDAVTVPREELHDADTLFVPDISQATELVRNEERTDVSSSDSKSSLSNVQKSDVMTEEDAEFNHLLDGFGPRFVDWWGTGVLPVDADLLPPQIPGYRTPFRLLPTGMRSRLTNAELTNLRKLARRLPCHFALGRNKSHHGLAEAIVKLWEKSLVVKIAVKRGVQNTNNKLMAEELKKLTGGILLLRNKYYIVIYRGKDFLPSSVAVTLAEREELTKEIQDVEERVRSNSIEITPANNNEGHPEAGTLAEFLEAQARWGREVTEKEREEMKAEASRSTVTRLVKRIENKLSLAQAKKLRAEKLLAKIEASMIPSGPSDDQETITDEERTVFRRIGLRMKAYLPLGIRGVFDGVIENMHLHWKYREVVKLISKQKTLSFVEDTARLLEYESGGILVAIEKVSKGYALIYYRGKNYQRPISIRPRNLLTKAKALKRSVAMQRHEALSQHISKLEETIDKYMLELGESKENNKENLDISYGSRDSQSSDSVHDYEDDFYLQSDDDDDDGSDDDESDIE